MRLRLVNKTVTEFNEITTKIEEMKDELSLQVDQLKSMQTKIQQWAVNVGKMEGRQGVLRMRLLELGVDVNNLQKSGPALEGIHFGSAITPSSTPSATVSRPEDLGTPVEIDVPTSTIQADIHSTPAVTTVDNLTSIPGTSTTSIAGHSTVGSDPSNPTASSSTAGQIIPLSSAQISHLITPGVGAVGGPQQIVNIAGQNVLISGSGPGTVGTSSVRYGKILKGVHKYFCPSCKRPFTQKESLTRQLTENCPNLQTKKKYKSKTCELVKFSSTQYLKEHIHEVHLKTPCYFCKGCGKGYFKHCNLSFHKKSCLAYLAPSQTQQQPQLPNLGVQQQQVPVADDLGIQQQQQGQVADENRQGDPLIRGQMEGDNDEDEDNEMEVKFQFSDPKNMTLPDL